MAKPLFITFTGIDQHTSLSKARALAEKYPIEFGILISPQRQGIDTRYPDWTVIRGIFKEVGYRYDRSRCCALHLCGAASKEVLQTWDSSILKADLTSVGRIQINTASKNIDTEKLQAWANQHWVVPILQCRDEFPSDPNVTWLFDRSGGEGLVPGVWPQAPFQFQRQMVGYAGGLSPENIKQQLPLIEAAAGKHPYYIDMESGVRTDGRFDLDKCLAVCKAVYG